MSVSRQTERIQRSFRRCQSGMHVVSNRKNCGCAVDAEVAKLMHDNVINALRRSLDQI